MIINHIQKKMVYEFGSKSKSFAEYNELISHVCIAPSLRSLSLSLALIGNICIA